MRKHLNTLFVTTQGAYLGKEGETVAVRVNGKNLAQFPVHTLGGIVCFGQVSCSPFLMGFCAERDVSISFLTERGRYLAKVQGPVSGNVLLRREQYRQAESAASSAGIARALTIGKIANCRTILQRALRDHGIKMDVAAVRKAADELAGLLKSLRDESLTMDSIRGFEGRAGHVYFSVFDHLITTQKADFYFQGRNRRPPLDNVNALLSFIYTLLCHDISSAIESAGLDPAVGFFHRDRPGRPSLALDLMEEFRPIIADRLVLTLINRAQVTGKGFEKSESGAVRMNDETRKTVLTAYQTRKQEEMIHPFLDEAMPIGLLFFSQALLLARYLRGDLDGYPPVIIK